MKFDNGRFCRSPFPPLFPILLIKGGLYNGEGTIMISDEAGWGGWYFAEFQYRIKSISSLN